MFKVVIVGGKEMGNYEHFRKKCIEILRNQAPNGIFIISTGDEFVDQFAERYKIDVEHISADFKKFGKEALKRRNEKLLEGVNGLIAFKPTLKDVKMIVKAARERNIAVREIKTT